MAYSVNWITRVITIPVSDMTLISGTEYDITATDFQSEVRRLEWDFGSLWADQILHWSDSKTLLGTTYAPFVEVINGYTVAFDVAASRVNLRGGNMNLASSAVLVNNGVLVIPNNSAGNTVSNFSQLSLDYKTVYLDPINGVDGSKHPAGTTRKLAVKTYSAAYDLSELYSQESITITGGTDETFATVTVLATESVEGKHIIGDNRSAEIYLQGCDTSQSSFENMRVHGDFSGEAEISGDCTFSSTVTDPVVNNFKGKVKDSFINGVLQIDATATKTVWFLRNYSNQEGIKRPTIDWNGAAANPFIREHNGSFLLKNYTDANTDGSINMRYGIVFLDATCTGGVISIDGVGRLVDEATGLDIPTGTWNGMTIVNKLENPSIVSQAVWEYDRA